MVYQACLRILRDAHEAEDASQAAFVVLARKARKLKSKGNLAAWLHGVALRTAREAVRARVRRARREEEAGMVRTADEGLVPAERKAVVENLDRELVRLPTALRQAVVLRYMEDRSQEEAAGVAGCPQGTLAWRARKGLERLRERLSRKGPVLGAAALAGLLEAEAGAAVPAALLPSLAAVSKLAAAGAAAGAAGGKTILLAEGAMKAMMWIKISAAAILLCAAAVVGGGGALAVKQLAAGEPKAPGKKAGPPKAPGKKAGLPKVPAAEKGPAVDGDLSDPVWKQALPLKLGGYCDAERRKKGEKPKDATEVKILTDQENLYVSFRCAESHPQGPWVYENARFKRRRCKNAHVMGGDYVAVALDMGRWGLYNYYVFFVNAKGELYKSFTWPMRYDLILRDLALPAATSAAKIDKAGKSWSAELKIPLKGLLRHPADGFPKVVGLDLRRVQWGEERGKAKFSIYWTGMANVSGKNMRPQYDHMATWKPLFETYPNYLNAYACGRGWVQLVFPESFGHLEFEAGKIDNKLVTGQGSRLIGLAGTRTGWHKPKEMRAQAFKAFDAPRMEHWADLRPVKHPEDKPVVVSTAPVRTAGSALSFTRKPSIKQAGKETRISFEVSARTDVIVAILDSKGKTIRHLASGVLGPNPPKPFKKDSLAQTITWDHKDDSGKPVGAGGYKAKVSLGLEPAFHYAIPIDKKNYWYQDKTPTDKGLDVDKLPNPKIGRTLGHFSRGTMNFITIDREREELYLQTRYVYDGRTGKKLRDLKLQGKQPFVLKGGGNGEIAVSPRDGLLYIGGPNEVWRFGRDGKPMPFGAMGRNFIPELWGAHSNPHRGISVGADGDVYMVHHYIPHTSPQNQVTRIGSDGRIKNFGFIEIRTSAAGVRVDRQGNVYVGCTIQPPDALPPKSLASKMPERPRKLFKHVYGSIVKFGPAGGIIKPDPAGDLVCPDYRARLQKYSAQGAKWIHPGYSPMLSRVSDDRGGPGCSCRNARFDLDDFGRLFIPDAVYGRIEVTDSNANTILFIGGRGAAGKKSGVELGWPTVVAASDLACYIADYLRFRMVRVKLGYVAEEVVEVKVR